MPRRKHSTLLPENIFKSLAQSPRTHVPSDIFNFFLRSMRCFDTFESPLNVSESGQTLLSGSKLVTRIFVSRIISIYYTNAREQQKEGKKQKTNEFLFVLIVYLDFDRFIDIEIMALSHISPLWHPLIRIPIFNERKN